MERDGQHNDYRERDDAEAARAARRDRERHATHLECTFQGTRLEWVDHPSDDVVVVLGYCAEPMS